MTHSLESKWNAHQGYVMRSLAEAKVAEFMTKIGVCWVYEHMPYDFRGYLPDFYLPNLDAFVEVKGAAATDDEIAKCERLHEETGRPVILSEGSPSGAGWQPRLLLAGYWRAIPMRKIRHAVDSCARPMKAERFRSAFDLSRIGEKIPRLIGMDCDVLRVSLHHEMDPKSRAIYEHNGPVTNDRLQDMRNIDRSDAELFCIDFLESRQEVEA